MPDGAHFCSNCGKPLDVSYPPPQYPYPQMFYGNRTQNPYGNVNPRKSSSSAKAVASLVLGIASGLLLLMDLLPYLYQVVHGIQFLVVLTGIVGLTLGISAIKDAKRQGKKDNIAVAGMVVSLVCLGLLLMKFLLILLIIGFIWLITLPFRY